VNFRAFAKEVPGSVRVDKLSGGRPFISVAGSIDFVTAAVRHYLGFKSLPRTFYVTCKKSLRARTKQVG